MILNAKNIAKSFLNQNGKLSVFSNISIDIKKGDLITIMGPSGSGKSTLLNILGTLESFDKGELTINGKELQASGRSSSFIFSIIIFLTISI